MASKTFMTITQLECLSASRKIVDNSESQWATGLRLSESGEFGSAIAMAIISMEELVKGMMVLADGRGFKLRSVAGIDTIFKNHQIRYVICFGMLCASIFGDEMVKFISSLRNEPERLSRLTKYLKEGNPVARKWLERYAIRKGEVIRDEFNWFSKVDLFRQDAFYSDFSEELKSPLNISRETYIATISRLKRVRQIGHYLVEALNSNDAIYRDHFNNMQKMFNEENYYKKISLALIAWRQSEMKNPFTFITQRFTN
jgi:AbiV family abortive infection protein